MSALIAATLFAHHPFLLDYDLLLLDPAVGLCEWIDFGRFVTERALPWERRGHSPALCARIQLVAGANRPRLVHVPVNAFLFLLGRLIVVVARRGARGGDREWAAPKPASVRWRVFSAAMKQSIGPKMHGG